MDAACHLECCFCCLEFFLYPVYSRVLGAWFCRVECLETRETVAGRSLHGMSLVVVVFLVEELILYAELLGVAGLRVETL